MEPRFDFEAIVRRHVGDISDGLLSTAIDQGDAFLAAANDTPSRDSYHRIMLEVLDIDASPDLLAELDAPLEPASVVEPLPRSGRGAR